MKIDEIILTIIEYFITFGIMIAFGEGNIPDGCLLTVGLCVLLHSHYKIVMDELGEIT